MAGTITCGTLSDGTNSTSSTNCIQGSAKAWVNFDSSSGSPVIRAAYNVSSITQNATGDYTVNFATALSDANYTMVGINNYSINDANRSVGYYQTSPTTTSARVAGFYQPTGSISFNSLYFQLAFFR